VLCCSLSANGERSQIADVTSESLKPSGWGSLHEEKPPLSAFKDISIYELHVRDFSASDEMVDPKVRGGYLAFAEKVGAASFSLTMLKVRMP
jgi:pullulanase/glycogen debranching enzyme